MSINNKIGFNLFNILIGITFFTLPILVPSWHGKILVILGIIWALSIRKNNIQSEIKNIPFFLVLIALTLYYVIGLSFSEDMNNGLSSIETIAPLLLLPFIIGTSNNNFSKKLIEQASLYFIAGVVTLNLASLFFISKNLWDPINLQSNIIIANNNVVKIHPAYSSLYLSFSIFFLVDQCFPLQTNDRKKLGWVLFALVILCGYLLWINSRTGIISFCIAFAFYSLYRFRSRSRVISLSVLAIFLMVIFTVPFSRERFFNAPNEVLFDGDLIKSNDPNIYPLIARKHILECSIELIKGPEFFYGYGTGDFRDVLNDCFKQKGYVSLYEKNLDQHNEYFAHLHRNGIIGLGLFLALLIIPFRYALKYRSPLLAVFVILFVITALFENVFSAQKGVTFFALFCPLLMLYAKKKNVVDAARTTPA